jgi:hypothetical protein
VHSETEKSHKLIPHRRRQAIQRDIDPLRTAGEPGLTGIWLLQALLLCTMATYIEWNGLAIGLSIKLTEVLYAPRVR